MSNAHRPQKLDLAESGPLTRVEEYKFEPIRGYPMLHWAGKRPFASTQYYPAQHKETYGPEVNGWRNKIYWGDNLQVMSHLLKEYRRKIRLVYIDPPFDSKADYKRTITVRGKDVTNDRTTFEEKQYTDIWANDDYLQFMYERLILIRELIADDGVIALHCDDKKSHHLRCLLDEVFGPNNFINEIIWHFPGRAMHLDTRFNRKHNNIFIYSKSDDFRLVEATEPWTEEEFIRVKKQAVFTDEDGRKFIWQDRSGGESHAYKRYLDDVLQAGKALDDVWKISIETSSDKRRTDYPTQKPEALIERLIHAASSPGDLVFDCFMGSGTLQAVAMKQGRRFLGADINLGAVQVTTKRLLSDASELQEKQPTLDLERDGTNTFYAGFEVYNVNNYDIFRNPVQAKELLIQALEVNPLQPGSLFDGEKDGRMVKVMPVNRITTRQDLNELITGFDYRAFERRQAEHPNQPVEKITLVCMGHEPDLAAHLMQEVNPYKLDIEVVDILRDKQDLQFRRDSEAKIVIRDGELVIEQFYPMSLLAKLSLQQEYVEEWRELVDSVMVDWNYDGAVLQPAVIDVPDEGKLVAGRYPVPPDAGTIRVKITDLLSESLEMELVYG